MGCSVPDDVTAGRHCQTPACVLARPKGRAKANWWQKPLECKTWRAWVVHSNDAALIYSGSLHVRLIYLGVVAGERLRVLAGDAVGVQPAADPVKRIMMNVGSAPRALGCWWQPGKARCRLMGAGCGGVRVVVRGRESRPHGQGGQQDRSMRRRLGGRA